MPSAPSPRPPLARSIAALALAAACGPGGRAPVAVIEGASLTAGYGTLVTLDGSRSRDPDGDPLTYRWRVLDAPDVARTARHRDRARFTLRTAPARARFPLRPTFGPVAIPRGGEGDFQVELVVSDGAHEGRAVARVRSAAVTGGWPRVETGLDLTVSCGKAEDEPAEWELVETPAASRAVVLEPDRCLARVRADLTGRYVLAERTSGRRLPFWYGPWVGRDECARQECHPNEAATWAGTKHASVFARGLDGGLGADYGPSCWGCHTLGQDTGGRSIGFRRASIAARWTPPRAPAPGTWQRAPAAVQLWANVQCEQCHGPGRFWTGLTADVCAQCHDAPPRYRIVADWRRSAMSVPPAGPKAARADCASCHAAHGGIARLAGGSASRPKEEPDAQGVTCPVCHDPHEARFPFQLRRFGDVTLAGRTVAAGGGAVCFACHGTYEGPAARDGHAPHAPQGFMLLTPAGEAPAPHAAVPDLCVGCHMKRSSAPRPPFGAPRGGRAGEASRAAMGGHTFALRGGGETLDAACRDCHRDVRGLAVGGGLGARRLAEDTERLRARVQAATRALGLRGCDGSPAADVVAPADRLVLVDTLGRPLETCERGPLPLPDAPPLLRAATLLLILDKDRSRGAHNPPLAAALAAEGLALLPAP